jgi:hypothetical protein
LYEDELQPKLQPWLLLVVWTDGQGWGEPPIFGSGVAYAKWSSVVRVLRAVADRWR